MWHYFSRNELITPAIKGNGFHCCSSRPSAHLALRILALTEKVAKHGCCLGGLERSWAGGGKQHTPFRRPLHGPSPNQHAAVCPEPGCLRWPIVTFLEPRGPHSHQQAVGAQACECN